MEGNALRKLLKLQEADMRLRDMETRLATLPKEMDNIIAKRDKAAASTSAAVRQRSCSIASIGVTV